MALFNNKLISQNSNNTKLRIENKINSADYSANIGEFNDRYYAYTIAIPDPENPDMIPGLRKPEFSNILLSIDGGSTLSLFLQPIQIPTNSDGSNIIFAKKQNDKISINPDAEQFASLFVREQTISILSYGNVDFGDNVVFLTKEPLTASKIVNNLYENIKIFILLQTSPKPNAKGITRMERLDLVRFASNTIITKGSDGSSGGLIQIIYPATPVAPTNARFCKITMNTMNIFGSEAFQFTNTNDFNIDYTFDSRKTNASGLDALTFNLIKIDTIGTTSFKITSQWSGEQYFLDQYLNKIKSQTDREPGGANSNWDIFQRTTDSTGRTDLSKPGNLQDVMNNGIPNTTYLIVSLNIFFVSGINDDLLDYLKNTWQVASQNGSDMSSYQDNTHEWIAFSEGIHPWVSNNSPWYNDVIKFRPTGGQGFSLYGVSELKLNPLFAAGNIFGRNRKIELLKSTTNISEVSWNQKLDSPLITSAKDDDVNGYASGNNDDKKYLVLSNVDTRDWLKIGTSLIWTSVDKRIASQTFLVPDFISLPENQAVQSGTSLNNNALYNPSISEPFIKTTVLWLDFIGEEQLKTITCSRLGDNLIFEFFDGNGNPSVGISENGDEIVVAPIQLKSPQLSGSSLNTLQQLILI